MRTEEVTSFTFNVNRQTIAALKELRHEYRIISVGEAMRDALDFYLSELADNPRHPCREKRRAA